MPGFISGRSEAARTVSSAPSERLEAMSGTGRILLAAGVAALMLAATGCGGYGVNLRSGGSSASPNQVAITATSGTTLNPYPLLVQHAVLFVAHPSAGNVVNYGIDQPVRWDSNNPVLVELLE